MRLSIAENMKAFLSPDELIAAQETMGVDNSLIDDETYYHIETKKKRNGAASVVIRMFKNL